MVGLLLFSFFFALKWKWFNQSFQENKKKQLKTFSTVHVLTGHALLSTNLNLTISREFHWPCFLRDQLYRASSALKPIRLAGHIKYWDLKSKYVSLNAPHWVTFNQWHTYSAPKKAVWSVLSQKLLVFPYQCALLLFHIVALGTHFSTQNLWTQGQHDPSVSPSTPVTTASSIWIRIRAVCTWAAGNTLWLWTCTMSTRSHS